MPNMNLVEVRQAHVLGLLVGFRDMLTHSSSFAFPPFGTSSHWPSLPTPTNFQSLHRCSLPTPDVLIPTTGQEVRRVCAQDVEGQPAKG